MFYNGDLPTDLSAAGIDAAMNDGATAASNGSRRADTQTLNVCVRRRVRVLADTGACVIFAGALVAPDTFARLARSSGLCAIVAAAGSRTEVRRACVRACVLRRTGC